MNQRIIYQNDEGGVAIVVPSGEVSIEQLIASVVPTGKSYKVVDVSDIPTDRTFRDAWEFTE
jgi:hypothetical protein